jgi:hypothetical protein
MLSDMKYALAALVLSLALTTPAWCQSRAIQQETAACQDDALRFCGPVIPDHAKIHACLLTYKAYLSAPCRAIVAPTQKRRRYKRH